MIFDVNLKVKGNRVIIEIPQLQNSTQVEAVMTTLQGQGVIGIGTKPEEEKKLLVKSIATMSEEELRRNKKRIPKQFLEMDHKKLSELYAKDKRNGTSEAWGLFEDNVKFVYPFDIESFNPYLIVKFILYYTNQLTREKVRKGYLGLVLNTFLDEYNYRISLDNYDRLSPETQERCLKVLADAKDLLKIKELTINGNDIPVE